MEHSKKFLLVPEERLNHFVCEQLSTMDREMNEILQKKDISDSKKAVLYQQILQKFVKFPFPKNSTSDDSETSKSKLPETIAASNFTPLNAELVKEEKVPSVEEEIIASAPQKFKSPIKEILNCLQQSDSPFTWSPDKELVVNGKVIRNTNIADLVNYLVRDRKTKPKGHELFLEALKGNKFPHHFIKNKYLRPKTLYAKPVRSWEIY